jgi:serine/threonine protein kinase
MIAFLCSACGAQLRVKDELAGKTGKCPACGREVQAPTTPTESIPEAAVGTERMAPLPPAAAEGAFQPAQDGVTLTSPVIPSSGPSDIFQAEKAGVTPDDLAFLAPPQAPDEMGRLGGYRVLKLLGVGGMGLVFQAEDTSLKRQVALKVMRRSLAVNENNRKRFVREAQTTAAIDHDHIVSIYQVGEDRGVPWLAMRLLQGETLDDRLKNSGGFLPLAEVLRIGREIAEGLRAAHERGLVHRDIKPANVWLEAPKDRVKIVDFGLARMAGTDVRLTQTGMLIGTPAYMAPEQARGDDFDHRCDLFSLGCVLYRMSTGELPFKGKDTMAMLMALASQAPVSPRKVDPGLPPAFSDLVMRLLAKDPADRPNSAEEVARDLEAIERYKGEPPKPAPPKAAPKPKSSPEAPRLERQPTPIPRARPEGEEAPARKRSPDGGSRQTPVPARQKREKIEVAAEDSVELVIEKDPQKDQRRPRPAKKKKRGERDEKGSGAERKVVILAIAVGVLIVGLLIYLFVIKPLTHRKDGDESGARPSEPVVCAVQSNV